MIVNLNVNKKAVCSIDALYFVDQLKLSIFKTNVLNYIIKNLFCSNFCIANINQFNKL